MPDLLGLVLCFDVNGEFSSTTEILKSPTSKIFPRSGVDGLC